MIQLLFVRRAWYRKSVRLHHEELLLTLSYCPSEQEEPRSYGSSDHCRVGPTRDESILCRDDLQREKFASLVQAPQCRDCIELRYRFHGHTPFGRSDLVTQEFSLWIPTDGFNHKPPCPVYNWNRACNVRLDDYRTDSELDRTPLSHLCACRPDSS